MAKPDAPSANFLFEPDATQSGLADLRKLIHPGAPDPERAGREFRFLSGEPLAVRMRGELAPGEAVPEALVGQSIDFLPAYFLEKGAERARATCRIVVSKGTDYEGVYRPGGWLGTGFLVARDILLTNHHVLNSPDVVRNAVSQFNYELGIDGQMETHEEFALRPDRLFVTSRDLDFTFVAIDPAASGRFGFVPLNRRFFAIEMRDRANVVQHPAGRAKEVVLHQNHVEADNGLVLHYTSDTEGGSSGSPVSDNRWEVVALHHAARRTGSGPGSVRNEGIKLSAIAADLEQKAQAAGDDSSAAKALAAIRGIDSGLGFFGSLGRRTRPELSDLERVVNSYSGTDQDIDVGAWNIEWFSNRYPEKIEGVARLVADLNLDVWALIESSPEAAEELLRVLRRRYGLEYEVAHSEPGASTGKQSTSVIWNPATVEGRRVEWPEEIDAWFSTHSRDFSDLGLEAVHGKIFNRYPGLFHFTARSHDGQAPLDFFVVPVHLKAKGEGSLRRDQASQILAAAVKRMKEIRPEADRDFVILGDFNATLASRDFVSLDAAGWSSMTAEDEEEGALTYLKGRYKSLIDHVYLSPNMGRRYGADDLFIVAADRSFPDYVQRISDHRPIVARFSRGEATEGDGASDTPSATPGLPPELRRALDELVRAYRRVRG